jgi:hypothetical protein
MDVEYPFFDVQNQGLDGTPRMMPDISFAACPKGFRLVNYVVKGEVQDLAKPPLTLLCGEAKRAEQVASAEEAQRLEPLWVYGGITNLQLDSVRHVSS